ncbi:MAG: sulfatase-like hydrolase/transferase [Anaerolineae bacterium]|nr:sulfatase-like hydrolase/transferase [Anaerolineae bacterium]
MQRPNILFIHTDQQRWDALGANGNSQIITPNLDKLALEGINLDHYFVQNPVCMPSRISYLSGLYPSTLGILRNGIPVPEDTITLPHLLGNYGYARANIGKLHFLPHANRDHRDPHPGYGFTHLEISDEPGCYEDAYRAWVRRKAPEQLDHISVGLPPAANTWYETMGIRDTVRHRVQGARFDFKGAIPFSGEDAFTHSAFVAEQTITFLKQHQDAPFLCIAGFYSPHSPWVVPQTYLDMYDPIALTLPAYPEDIEAKRHTTICSDEQLRSARHGYYAMISEVDHWVGSILACLDDLGLRDNTIVIFTSDHGEWLGEHLRYGKGYPAHDCISRVPFIIRWPKGLKLPGRTFYELVEAVDIVPTLLDCAGIPVPYPLQGQSLLPMLENRPLNARGSALTEMEGTKTLRVDGFRYVAHDDGQEHLYNLAQDPAGYRDVAADPAYAPKLAELRHTLLQRLMQNKRPRRRVWAY